MMNVKSMFWSKLVIAMLYLIGSPAKGQIFSTGLKAGMTTTSNINIKEMPNLGMTAGFMGELKLCKWMRLRTEANFLLSGREHHFWASNTIHDASVELPLMLTFMPVKNLHIGGGVALQYLLFSKGAELPENQYNFGVLGHIEYRFFKRLGLGVRYIHQLSNFSNIKDIGNSIGQNNSSEVFPNSSLQLTLSYSFGK